MIEKNKKIIAGLALVLMLTACFTAYLPIGAEAAYIGEISEVNVKLSMPPVVCGEVSGISASLSTKGCSLGSMTWYDMYGQPMTGTFTYDNATVVITVNASPGYFFSGNVRVGINDAYAAYENHGSQLVLSQTFSPVVWAPSIVKHPGSERVVEGGMVSFVSLASFTTESVWTVIDTKGVHYSLDKLAEKFPQLVFHTTYSKLNISPIPMEMNGYKVRCSFTGPGGSVDSGYAEITVEKSEQSAAVQEQHVIADHDHVYSEELVSDAGYHWHPCFCGAIDVKEEHNFTWLQKREATLDAPGIVRGECSDCGYVIDCRTQLEPEAAEALKKEAEQAQSVAVASPTSVPSPSPTPHEKTDLKSSIRGLFNLFNANEREYTPE